MKVTVTVLAQIAYGLLLLACLIVLYYSAASKLFFCCATAPFLSGSLAALLVTRAGDTACALFFAAFLPAYAILLGKDARVALQIGLLLFCLATCATVRYFLEGGGKQRQHPDNSYEIAARALMLLWMLASAVYAFYLFALRAALANAAAAAAAEGERAPFVLDPLVLVYLGESSSAQQCIARAHRPSESQTAVMDALRFYARKERRAAEGFRSDVGGGGGGSGSGGILARYVMYTHLFFRSLLLLLRS